MPLLLTDLDVTTLRKLMSSEPVTLSSALRLRLELAGLIRDGAAGIELTPEGRRSASQRKPAADRSDGPPGPKADVDKRGRRMPNRRKLP